MYKPGFILFLLYLIIFLSSCAPVIYPESEKEVEVPAKQEENINILNELVIEKKEKTESLTHDTAGPLKTDISIILPKGKKKKITNQFINVIEMAVYEKQLEDISFSVNLFEDFTNLEEIIESSIAPGKIFIGPTDSFETKLLSKYCKSGAIFFSFSSEKKLAKDCVFLVNFFPENELEVLFKNFKPGSKIALLYPENSYGYNINLLIDEIADQSDSVIINRASYSEDLTNVREAIKELGKYELRKYELERQKLILASKKDEQSIKRLKRLQNFKTTSDFDFTHILLPDYGVRLLQVAPLLPYYDVDPNIVQFVGTGDWDDPIFFKEPSLQKAIFPGVEIRKRSKLIKEYQEIYEYKLMRTSTLVYDLIGLISYVYEQKMNSKDFYALLNDLNTRFDGVDGRFYFKNNVIRRELNLLKISNGKAVTIN